MSNEMTRWKQTGEWGHAGEPDWDQDTGAPTLSHFANAVQVWSSCQDRSAVTVAEAAMAFMVPPARIYEAVEEHYWMFLGGDGKDPTKDTIEHDGE